MLFECPTTVTDLTGNANFQEDYMSFLNFPPTRYEEAHICPIYHCHLACIISSHLSLSDTELYGEIITNLTLLVLNSTSHPGKLLNPGNTFCVKFPPPCARAMVKCFAAGEEGGAGGIEVLPVKLSPFLGLLFCLLI